ncbi:MAG: hypothetical protein EB044_04740 [Actinobacteria bacterium]|jgi:hypothetical protein|nr:hypothetical protein [Actinomycetota bacterium]
MEILIALGIVTLVAVNAPVETKAPQEIKSAQTSVEVVQPVKPKAKPKKKAVKKVAKADPAKQQPSKENLKADSNKQPATKETAKAEPVKKDPPATVSSPEQKSNQSNLLYYILGFLTLGATAAYFYFRKKSQTTDAKIYTSDELKQSLQQDTDKFKYQPPTPNAEPQSQSSSDPKTDDENKKS